jgi:Lipocalin-like domain
MKRMLSIGVVSLFIGMIAMTLCGGQDRGGNEGIRERFVSAWRLVSLEAPGPGGKIHRADSTGLLVFTPDGHMSVRVMERNPPPQASASTRKVGTRPPLVRLKSTKALTPLTFHVEGALVRTLIGKDLPRSFEFASKQPIVKSTRPEEHWKVTWEHY